MERTALLRAMGGVLLAGLAAVCLLEATVTGPDGATFAPTLLRQAQAALAGTSAQAAGKTRHEDIGPVRYLAIPPGRQEVTVPILMYHYITNYDNPQDRFGSDLSVKPDDFRAQMDYLDRAGYHPIDFNDLRGYLHGARMLPSRPVILTFDDGYADFYTTAYPVLAQHGFKAVSYVVPGFFGRVGYMTADQVKQLDRAGVEIASHTLSHLDLTTLGPEQLAQQLREPKEYLERLLGHPVLDFCYPSGRFNAPVVQAVAAAGYQTATTTQLGYRHSLGDSLTWARVRVHGNEGLDRFSQMLGPEEPAVEAWIDPYPAPALPLLPEILPIIYPGSTPGPAPLPPTGR